MSRRDEAFAAMQQALRYFLPALFRPGPDMILALHPPDSCLYPVVPLVMSTVTVP